LPHADLKYIILHVQLGQSIQFHLNLGELILMKGIYVGVYLERSGATLIRSRLTEHNIPWPDLNFTDYEIFEWAANKPEEAYSSLSKIIELINKTGSDLRGVGVASYGPFVSLKASSPDYGVINPNISHWPLRGLDLRSLFLSGMKSVGSRGSKVKLIINTDANAGALGEAFLRRIPSDSVLAYLLATEGIGAGIVIGREIFRSALHSEIGLLHVRYNLTDDLRPSKDATLYSRSLSDMSDNSSLYQRYALNKKRNVESISRAALENFRDDWLWDLRAYYLAQGCIACAALLSPHRIVVAADIDPQGRLAERVRIKFNSFMRERDYEMQPIFPYEEMRDTERFISPVSVVAPLRLEQTLGTIGAVGMCVAAALPEKAR
jgi:predicted NBD/HSP70 family sugar kinase